MSRFGSIGTQYFDNAGNPLVSGKLYFYDSGTNTPKTTYADINQTVPNTNPVLLTAAGRQPNIFFNGSVKAVLTDADDVQIEVRDPIGGDTEEGVFSPWNSITIYEQGSIVVGSDGGFYISITNGNQGNDPTLDDVNWTSFKVIRNWNENETYSTNALVQGADGQIYFSLAASNLNHDPVTPSPLWWRAVTHEITDNSGDTALKVTQLGAGLAFQVADQSGDTTTFSVDALGNVIMGWNAAVLGGVELINSTLRLQQWSSNTTGRYATFYKSRSASVGTQVAVSGGDNVGGLQFFGSDGNQFIQGAEFAAQVASGVSNSLVPMRFLWSTMDSTGVYAERMRLSNNGSLGLGSTSLTGYGLRVAPDLTGATTAYGVNVNSTIKSDVTTAANVFHSAAKTDAAAFTLSNLFHFRCGSSSALGAGSTITNQYGFYCGTSLTEAANNYGFYSAGAAKNVFVGNTRIGSATDPTVSLDVTGGVIIEALDANIGAGVAALRVNNRTTSAASFRVDDASSDNTPFVIDGDGNVIVGYTNTIATPGYNGTNLTAGMELIGTTQNAASLSSILYASSTGAAGSIVFARSSVSSLDTIAPLASGYILGALIFDGADNTAFVRAARYSVECVGTVSTGYIPVEHIWASQDTTGTLRACLHLSERGELRTSSTQFQGAAPTSVAQAFRLGLRSFTFTDTSTLASGTVAWGALASFGQMTIAAANASVTYSDAATLYVGTPPTAGTNVTITRRWGLYVDTGSSYFGGNVTINGKTFDLSPAPYAPAAAATMTAANLTGGLIVPTGTTYTLTLPLGTTMDGVTSLTDGFSFEFSLVNTASGTITIGTNTGWTLVGVMTVATGLSATFRVRRTATSTYTLYRIT